MAMRERACGASISVGRLFQTHHGGPEIVEPPVNEPRFVPQSGVAGREHQHTFQHRQRAAEILALHQPQLDVVLQAQQHRAIGHGRVVIGLQFRVRPLQTLEQTAQRFGVQRLAEIERIDDRAPVGPVDAHQEMAGEGQAPGSPALGARGVDPQHGERHGQTAPAIDHMGEIGIAKIVVGIAIAAIAQAFDQRVMQRHHARGDRVGFALRFGRHARRDFRQMRAIGRKIEGGARRQRQRQRRLADREIGVARLRRRAQFALGFRHTADGRVGGDQEALALFAPSSPGGGRKRRGSSLLMMWLTTRRILAEVARDRQHAILLRLIGRHAQQIDRAVDDLDRVVDRVHAAREQQARAQLVRRPRILGVGFEPAFIGHFDFVQNLAHVLGLPGELDGFGAHVGIGDGAGDQHPAFVDLRRQRAEHFCGALEPIMIDLQRDAVVVRRADEAALLHGGDTAGGGGTRNHAHAAWQQHQAGQRHGDLRFGQETPHVVRSLRSPETLYVRLEFESRQASCRCRGHRPGATRMASNLVSNAANSGRLARKISAARTMRWRWAGCSASIAASRSARSFTSTKASTRPRAATISTCAAPRRRSRPTMRQPAKRKRHAARVSAQDPRF